MNRYAELRNKQQEEFNALPLGFAFSDKQFREMMKKWGLDAEKDLDKIYGIPGGSFVQKKDHAHVHEVMDRHEKEMQDAISEDKSGEGFIYEMFTSNEALERLEYDERITNRIKERTYQVAFPEESVREYIARENNKLLLQTLMRETNVHNQC